MIHVHGVVVRCRDKVATQVAGYSASSAAKRPTASEVSQTPTLSMILLLRPDPILGLITPVYAESSEILFSG